MRRTAYFLGVNRRMLANRVVLLGQHLRSLHEDKMKKGYFTGTVYSFDEMETNVGGKNNPVTVGIAVCESSNRIVDITLGRIKLKGRRVEKLKAEGKHIPEITSEKLDCVSDALEKIEEASYKGGYDLATDALQFYKPVIREVLVLLTTI